MTTYSNSGFSGGTKASPAIAPHPMGLTSRAGHGFITGATAQILDADSPEVIRIVSPSTAITQDLPSTGVKAGRVFRLVVSGATEANYVALRSSNGTEFERIGGAGFVLVQALIDSPTTAAHWEVLDVSEQTSVSGTPTGANTNEVTVVFNRNNRQVIGRATQTPAAAVGATNITLASGFMPSRFRTSQASSIPVYLVNNNVTTSGFCNVASDGRIQWFKSDGSSSNFSGTSGVSGALGSYQPFSYLLY